MQPIDEWKNLTHKFEDEKLWHRRKRVLGIDTDAEYNAYLENLKTKSLSEKDITFLKLIIDNNVHVNTDLLIEKIVDDLNPFNYSLMGINVIAKNKIKFSFSKYLSHLVSEKRDIVNELMGEFINKTNEFKSATVLYEYHIFLKANSIIDLPKNQLEFIKVTNNSSDWLEYFAYSYPVLISTLRKFIEDYEFELDRFFGRIQKDYEEILHLSNIEKDAKIIKINMFIGDAHKGNQSTCKIEIMSKSVSNHIYYKPRNLNADIALMKLHEELVKLGLPKTVNYTKNISKEYYGWQIGEVSTPFEKETEVKDFYKKQGINLAIAYFFNVQDLIADNIIISDKLPTFFDLEMAFLPKSISPIGYASESNANKILDGSILRTGLLPTFGFETATEDGYSNAGLSIVSGNKYLGYKFISSRLTLDRLDVESNTKNIPVIKGKMLGLDNFCKDLEDGFNMAYLFFVKNKEQILNKFIEIIESNNDLQSRILLRYTHNYSAILNEIHSPKYFSSYFTYKKLIELYWRAYDEKLMPVEVIVDELSQIENNEVPYFQSKINSVDLFDSNNNILVKNYFELSGKELIIERIQNASENDRRFQNQILKRSLIIHNNYKTNITLTNKNKVDYTIENKSEVNSKISQFLYDFVNQYNDKDFCSYLDYTVTKGGMWSQGIQSPDIFQGVEGLGVYFASVYKDTKDIRYLDYVIKIFNQSIKYFRDNVDLFKDSFIAKIGLTNYPISTLYYYILVNEIIPGSIRFEEQDLLGIINYIKLKYTNDVNFCYFSGSTGAILILLKLYELSNDETLLKLAIVIGNNLVDKAIEIDSQRITWKRSSYDKWGGFAHGNSGTSYCLFKLANFSKNDKFYNAGIKSLNYDQSLLDVKRKVWVKSIEFDVSIHHGWATGSAGIGLSRKLISDYYKNDLMFEEMEITNLNIDNYLLLHKNNDQSICSGFLGMLEVHDLLNLTRNSEHQLLFQKYMNSLKNVYDIKTGGWEKQELITGLFYGLSGIGYNIYKLDKSLELPSLLWI